MSLEVLLMSQFKFGQRVRVTKDGFYKNAIGHVMNLNTHESVVRVIVRLDFDAEAVFFLEDLETT
jgi:hypothetical protein